MTVNAVQVASAAQVKQPRLGFLGVGWIGLHRLGAIVKSGVGSVAAVADPIPEHTAEAERLACGATRLHSLHEMLDAGLDGIVIATPSALHAEQTVMALEHGVAVFCQKPLARTASEARRAVGAARAVDRLLEVDLSYRRTEGMRRIRELVRAEELGAVHAVDLVFHNAYGPDKSWYRDFALAGGGCTMDLGTHLVDLALWVLDYPKVSGTTSRLFAGGRPVRASEHLVEDYAEARLDLETGAVVRIACSWNLHAGRDAVIGASFYGSRGGAALRNVNGSFFDFVAERYRGTARELLCEPPDEWGGRAVVAWAQRLADGGGYDANAERLVDLAAVMDSIYER